MCTSWLGWGADLLSRFLLTLQGIHQPHPILASRQKSSPASASTSSQVVHLLASVRRWAELSRLFSDWPGEERTQRHPHGTGEDDWQEGQRWVTADVPEATANQGTEEGTEIGRAHV